MALASQRSFSVTQSCRQPSWQIVNSDSRHQAQELAG
jgi:hypothetical protein